MWSIVLLILWILMIVALFYFGVWARRTFLPGAPASVDMLLWGVCAMCLVLLVLYFFGVGLSGHPPQLKVSRLEGLFLE